MTATADLRERPERSAEQRLEPGAAEVQDLLQAIPGGAPASSDAVHLERLHKGVYRLQVGGDPLRTFIVKRHTPAIAHTDRLVAERWLPALGLGDRSSRLVAAAAQREGRWVWHVYEDLSGATLAERRERAHVEAAIELIAQLHTRGARHPILPEVRWHARDHGARALTAHLRDGIVALEAVAPAFAATRCGLLERLRRLLDLAPGMVRFVEQVGEPDTLLHGDLFPKNVFMSPTVDGPPRARLIDWDHVGVGPSSYDLSTFLYRSPRDERRWLLQCYRARVERDGYRLPADDDLNRLFYIAEAARGASSVIWPALALLNDGAEWGRTGLVEIESWFDALRPPLPEPAGAGA